MAAIGVSAGHPVWLPLTARAWPPAAEREPVLVWVQRWADCWDVADWIDFVAAVDVGHRKRAGLGLGPDPVAGPRKVLWHQHKVIGVLVGAARTAVVLTVAQDTYVGDGGTNGRIGHHGH